MNQENIHPEPSKREDSECDLCNGDCKCFLRYKKPLVISRNVKNEVIEHNGKIIFTI